MKEQKEQKAWKENAAKETRECWKSFISSRVEFALERVSRDPEYIKVCKQQDSSQEAVNSLLEKLGEENALTIRRYYEMETTRQSYEMDGAYMQGVKDGIHFLSSLGIFQPKEWIDEE